MEKIYRNYNSKVLKNKLFIIYKIICILLAIKLLQLIINKIKTETGKTQEINKRIISFPPNNGTEKINTINNNSLINLNNNLNNTINNETKNDMQKLLSYKHISSNSFEIFKELQIKYFKIIDTNYFFSIKYHKVKLEYIVGFYDQNQNLLSPSEMTLYNDLHFACFLELSNKEIINSLANIYLDKYVKCIEYYEFKENINFGLTIYKKANFLNINFKAEDIINYGNISHKNDKIFNPWKVKRKYFYLINKIIKTHKMNKTYPLKTIYIKKPIIDLRRNRIQNNSSWVFRNFYNNYFCFCIGKNCFKKDIPQKCKYLYYSYIIDNSKNLYPKTDYIFVDFIFKFLTADDTYPVFEEMMKRNYSAHYITEKEDITEKYCQNKTKCETIIPINNNTYSSYGDFFEKYLTLVLKTKAFISVKEKFFHWVGYLFYKIEYVTYIAVGHGVCYFKDYLFDKNRIYGKYRNNKILIPPSKVLISIAVNHGWKEENIIKINLPRWDRYNHPLNQDKITDRFSGNITNNSIFVMFTWRMNKVFRGFKNKISPFYMKNLTKLLQNEDLKNELVANNITLYVSFHRYLTDTYHNIIKNILKNNNNIKVIEQNDISECLAKTNLVVSDFSSVIFDLMYRNKPFIIYVPDANDPKVKSLYYHDYIDLIKRMNEGDFKVANKCNTVEETVQKIIYYIKNKFKIDDELKKYFEYFNFKPGNNVDEFINYLLKLQ